MPNLIGSGRWVRVLVVGAAAALTIGTAAAAGVDSAARPAGGPFDGLTVRVSVGADGRQANRGSFIPAVSADDRAGVGPSAELPRMDH